MTTEPIYYLFSRKVAKDILVLLKNNPNLEKRIDNAETWGEALGILWEELVKKGYKSKEVLLP